MSNSDFTLILCLPGDAPKRHDLSSDLTTLGRGPDNDIQVLVSEVSGKHANITREGDGFRLIDNGSTNGTRVNDAPIGPGGVVLKAMDHLLFGTVVPAYFVPAAILATSSLEDVVASLAAAAPGPAQAAPVRTAKPVSPVGPVAPGGATVRLEQVRPPVAAPGGVRPPVAAPAASGGIRPPIAAPAVPGGVRPPVAAPAASGGIRPPIAAPAVPGGVRPPVPAPPTASGGIRPPAVAPPTVLGGVRPPVAAPPAAPSGVHPPAVAPRPVPLAQPGAAPAPRIPLPKKPES